MRRLKYLIGLILAFCLLAGPVLALTFPQPSGYVNDFAGVLSSSVAGELETDLTNFEKESSAEIAVVTVDSLEGTTVEDYAVRLFEQWQIGKKDKDNGILILIAKEDRKMRIEVGYGLEPIITDGRAGNIIREQITPAFKNNDYEAGIKAAVGKIEDYIRSGEPPQGIELTKEQTSKALAWIVFIVIIGIYSISFWTRAMARSKRIWPGSLAGAGLGAILGLLVGTILFWVVLFGFLGLLLDWLLSRNYKRLKKLGRSTGFWSSRGGFFSGGGGSSGGSGGFGGGSSGGGGASGGW